MVVSCYRLKFESCFPAQYLDDDNLSENNWEKSQNISDPKTAEQEDSTSTKNAQTTPLSSCFEIPAFEENFCHLEEDVTLEKSESKDASTKSEVSNQKPETTIKELFSSPWKTTHMGVYKACKTGNISFLKSLFKPSRDRNALHIACKYANDPKGLELIKYCLDAGAFTESLDANGDTPLHIVCSTGNLEAFNLIMAEKNGGRKTASSLKKCNKKLIEHKNERGETLLQVATKSGATEITKKLLAYMGRSEKDVLPDQTKRNQNTVAIEPLEPNLATENTAVDEKNSTEGIIPPFSEKPKAAAQPKKHHIDLNFFTKSSSAKKDMPIGSSKENTATILTENKMKLEENLPKFADFLPKNAEYKNELGEIQVQTTYKIDQEESKKNVEKFMQKLEENWQKSAKLKNKSGKISSPAIGKTNLESVVSDLKKSNQKYKELLQKYENHGDKLEKNLNIQQSVLEELNPTEPGTTDTNTKQSAFTTARNLFNGSEPHREEAIASKKAWKHLEFSNFKPLHERYTPLSEEEHVGNIKREQLAKHRLNVDDSTESSGINSDAPLHAAEGAAPLTGLRKQDLAETKKKFAEFKNKPSELPIKPTKETGGIEEKHPLLDKNTAADEKNDAENILFTSAEQTTRLETIKEEVELKMTAEEQAAQNETDLADLFKKCKDIDSDTDVKTVKKLINRISIDTLNTPNKSGQTIIHLACSSKSSEIVGLLLNREGIDCNIQNNRDLTPLHIACERNSLDIVKYLAEKEEVDCNIQDSKKQTPLHIACERNSLDIVEYLAEKKEVDCNIQDSKGQTPLHTACKKKFPSIVDALLYIVEIDRNLKNNDGHTALHLACASKNLKVVKLLENDCDVELNIADNMGKIPFHIACEFGTPQIVSHLIRNVDINIEEQDLNGQTPLHLACDSNGSDNVIALARYYKEINANMETDVQNKDGETPLHIASRKGYHVVVNNLLKIGVKSSLQIKNINGKTPLMLAETKNDDIIANILHNYSKAG